MSHVPLFIHEHTKRVYDVKSNDDRKIKKEKIGEIRENMAKLKEYTVPPLPLCLRHPGQKHSREYSEIL